MNLLILIFHLLVVGSCTLLALRKGAIILVAWIALQSILANLFVLKQISLFGANITCSDAFAIGSIFGLNLLREYVGKEWATLALKTSIWLMLFFAAMSQLHLLYIPSSYDSSHDAYQTLLSASPRLILASLLTFYAVQTLELRLFAYLKHRLPTLPFVIRNITSTTLCQALDTALFSFLGLYGLISCLTSVMLMSFLTKLLIIALMGPLLHFSKRCLPHVSLQV